MENSTDHPVAAAGQPCTETGSEVLKDPEKPPVDWLQPLDEDCAETGGEAAKNQEEPPADWLQPLDEDYADEDAQSGDQDMESLAGSERSGSVAGSDWNIAGGGTMRKVRKPRRRVGDEDWEEWPVLGEGWKRRTVLRRSGLSMGQMDTYYMSPSGDRVRSKIELSKYLKNTLDLTNFDFRMGKFFEGDHPKRAPRKRRKGHSSPADCGFSSESSFQNESADMTDRTYSPGPPFSLSRSSEHRLSPPASQKRSTASPCKPHNEPSITPTTPYSALTAQNIPANGGPPARTPDSATDPRKDPMYIPRNAVLGICSRCRNSFTGVEGQTMCVKCSKACTASKDNRNIVFRKWLPCGFCRACQLTEDCGTCASCRNGKMNPDARRPVRCRKRKCLCPSLKKPDRLNTLNPDAKISAPQYSDSDEHSAFNDDEDEEDEDDDYYDEDDDDEDDDDDDCVGGDDDDEVVKKQRRSCGRCKGCVSKTDCGMCDFCIDKPKFGGSNKKRQKCRRRQCQREAMRHLLPESGHTPVLTPQGWVVPGRPRPNYTYGRKKSHQNRERWDFDFSDNEDSEKRKKASIGVHHLEREKISTTNYKVQPSPQTNTARLIPIPSSNTNTIPNSNQIPITENGLQARAPKPLPTAGVTVGVRPAVPEARLEEKPLHPRTEKTTQHNFTPQLQEEDEAGPTIAQIFSLGRNDSMGNGVDLEPELLDLLSSLRRSAMPVLWCPLLVEGPRLQLLQCSKLSSMADTLILIEPNFRFHISVQGQPLLPTHRLYSVHPPRLDSSVQVIAMLEDLERYAVCRGFETVPLTGPEPVFQERAATCEFLVMPEAKRCSRCRNELHKR